MEPPFPPFFCGETKEVSMLTALAIVRKAKEIPQWKLGMSMGITPGFLSLIESGRRRPDPDLAQRLANYLGMEVEDLFPSIGGQK